MPRVRRLTASGATRDCAGRWRAAALPLPALSAAAAAGVGRQGRGRGPARKRGPLQGSSVRAHAGAVLQPRILLAAGRDRGRLPGHCGGSKPFAMLHVILPCPSAGSRRCAAARILSAIGCNCMPCTQVDMATRCAMPEYGRLLQALGYEVVRRTAAEAVWGPCQTLAGLRLDREALEAACPGTHECAWLCSVSDNTVLVAFGGYLLVCGTGNLAHCMFRISFALRLRQPFEFTCGSSSCFMPRDHSEPGVCACMMQSTTGRSSCPARPCSWCPPHASSTGRRR